MTRSPNRRVEIITGGPIELLPVGPREPNPVYAGETADKLHYNRGCDRDTYYDNQILVPKRHSVIAFCPKCGCVTCD